MIFGSLVDSTFGFMIIVWRVKEKIIGKCLDLNIRKKEHVIEANSKYINNGSFDSGCKTCK